MTVTKTYEPIRPLRAPDDGSPHYSTPQQTVGNGRVDYGLSTWPSRSYWFPVPNQDHD
jgi:hypothetical protein